MSNSHAKINSFAGTYNLLHEIYSKNPTFSIFGHNVEPIIQYKTIKKELYPCIGTAPYFR